MISFIRNSHLLGYFWGFLALYIFNLSADAPDFYFESIPEDLTYNEQESFVEILVEKVLGFEDAIAEYDDNDDTQESALKKNFSLEFFVISEYSNSRLEQLTNCREEGNSQYHHLFLSSFLEIQSPPPEV